MTITYREREVEVEYNYTPYWGGTHLDPPEHESAEVSRVELNGRNITKYVDKEEIEQIILEKINY